MCITLCGGSLFYYGGALPVFASCWQGRFRHYSRRWHPCVLPFLMALSHPLTLLALDRFRFLDLLPRAFYYEGSVPSSACGCLTKCLRRIPASGWALFWNSWMIPPPGICIGLAVGSSSGNHSVRAHLQKLDSADAKATHGERHKNYFSTLLEDLVYRGFVYCWCRVVI